MKFDENACIMILCKVVATDYFVVCNKTGMDPCPICGHYFPLCDPANQAGGDELDFTVSILKKDDTESIVCS